MKPTSSWAAAPLGLTVTPRGSVVLRTAILGGLLLCGACTSTSEVSTTATSPEELPTSPTDSLSYNLWLAFDDPGLDSGEEVSTALNTGSWHVEVATVTGDGGVLRTAVGRQGKALAFPGADTDHPKPLGALRIRRLYEIEPYPGPHAFMFGADFQLDRVPDGIGDDGNNILQRGLWADESQFKLQVDRGTPSCLVRGDKGELYVEADITVEEGTWYRVNCERQPEELILRLIHFLPDGSYHSAHWSTQGRTGNLNLTKTWISVGAKLAWDGSLVKNSSDQFNGLLDNVVIADVNQEGLRPCDSHTVEGGLASRPSVDPRLECLG